MDQIDLFRGKLHTFHNVFGKGGALFGVRVKVSSSVFVHGQASGLGQIVEKQSQSDLGHGICISHRVNAVLPYVVLMEGRAL